MASAPLHVIVLVWYCTLWSYILVLHELSTPRYDTERLVWSEDIKRFDIVWLDVIHTSHGPDLVLPRVGRLQE